MAFRGRPPKPADQRLTRHKRAEFGVIEADSGQMRPIPPAPRGLLKRTRERWEAYFSSPVANAVDIRSDGAALERLAWYWDTWERFRTDRGMIGSMVKLEQHMVRLEEQLGMTPMSRLKLGLVVGEAKMTAERLRRMLRESSEPETVDEWDEEWAE